MTEILLPLKNGRHRGDAIRGGMDLLFLVNTRHLRQADERLAKLGLGRAHHRLLYFVKRKPGISIKETLVLLSITKQSFDRVIKDLFARGLIEQQPGVRDRRQRLLSLTLAGEDLEETLFDELQINMDKAYAAAGDDAVAGFWVVLQHLIGEEGRARFNALQHLTREDMFPGVASSLIKRRSGAQPA